MSSAVAPSRTIGSTNDRGHLEIVLAEMAAVGLERERAVGTLNRQNLVTLFFETFLPSLVRLGLRAAFRSHGLDLGLQLLDDFRLLILLHVTNQKTRHVRTRFLDRALHDAETAPLVPQVRVVCLGHPVERIAIVPSRSGGLGQSVAQHPFGHHVDAVAFRKPELGIENDFLTDAQFERIFGPKLVLVSFGRGIGYHQAHQLVVHPVDEVRRGEYRLRMLRTIVEPASGYLVRIP